MSLINEKAFADVFGGYDDNEARMDRYLEKRPLSQGPWILEYEMRGQTIFTTETTPQDALRRTNEKEPEAWIFNEIMPEKAWFEREVKV